jgi:hypothetical protein
MPSPIKEGFFMSTNEAQESLLSQIPLDVQAKVKSKLVVETSFATGPGFCAGKVEKHNPPITFEQGIAWLERYRGDLKGGCVIFDGESRLWFSWGKFDRYEARPKTPRPEPGITLADLTDPETLKLFGCRREGNKVVTDQKEPVVLGEYTDEQLKVIKSREAKKRAGRSESR